MHPTASLLLPHVQHHKCIFSHRHTRDLAAKAEAAAVQ
jgi:hypothetical protein